ncbi:dicarboxylate/amino acid:cation symporter [Lachnospiraceae bacterium 62-35]
MKMKSKLPPLTVQILIAAVLGMALGIAVGPPMTKVKFIGDIFINLVMMAIYPMVMSAIAMSFVGSGNGSTGRMGLHTVKWIAIFTFISAMVGLGIGLTLKPGADVFIDASGLAAAEAAAPSLADSLLGFIPNNAFSSMAGGNMVQCIVFSIFFGIAIGAYARKSGDETLVNWIKSVNGACMHIITEMVMKVAPIGIFCMIANVAGSIGIQVIFTAGKYLLCLVIGDIIQFAIYMPFTAIRCGVSPLKMPKKFAKMSFMALTTTSSSVCLPTKMEDEVTKFGISRQVADFTGPITASMNSCGAVNCYVIVILFAAQATRSTLHPQQLALSILIAAMMCMGTITVPGGLVATLTTLVTTMGLPVESIALVIGIDWFAGACRTLMNVDVDVCVGMLVAKALGEFDKDVYNEVKTVTYEVQ